LVEEAAAAAESMQHQASNLAQVVSVFKLDDRNTASMALQASTEPARKKVAPLTGKNSARILIATTPENSVPASRPRPASNEEWEEF